MIRTLLLSALGTSLLLSSGCLFSRKPRESSAIASEIEASFRQRWVDQRAGQLVAQGATADAARAQATTEFNERFSATLGSRK